MPLTLFDTFKSRLTLKKQVAGTPYNWLFIPGGPGADSSYFDELIELCALPGNSWTVDFFENGSNTQTPGVFDADYDFSQWGDALVSLVKSMDNVVLVGHSFGGLFPLLFPEIEQYCRGFVILNSVPSEYLEKAVEKAAIKQLPSFEKEMAVFESDKSPENFSKALEACVPYYFPLDSLERGRALLADLPFNYLAAGWGQTLFLKEKDFAKWIPNQMPLLIVGASEDCVTPIEMYQSDQRFKRDNIKIVEIKDAGHFPWVEKPEEVKNLFDDYVRQIES